MVKPIAVIAVGFLILVAFVLGPRPAGYAGPAPETREQPQYPASTVELERRSKRFEIRIKQLDDELSALKQRFDALTQVVTVIDEQVQENGGNADRNVVELTNVKTIKMRDNTVTKSARPLKVKRFEQVISTDKFKTPREYGSDRQKILVSGNEAPANAKLPNGASPVATWWQFVDCPLLEGKGDVHPLDLFQVIDVKLDGEDKLELTTCVHPHRADEWKAKTATIAIYILYYD